jgi:high-affinity nickel-transport protein
MYPHRWLTYAVPIAGLHILGFALLGLSAANHPALLGMGVLAYILGLRHAFDVDHIAAIDNTVRKLVEQRSEPMGVGFFFSLGHCTVVACLTLVTAGAVRFAQQQLPQLQSVGEIVGAAVSGTFLLVIGCINLFIFADIYRLFVRMRKGVCREQDVEKLLISRGFLARFVNPLLKLITKSWHVYPVGFLFGLGFDTASEVALLAISAEAEKTSVSWTGIFALPLLFASGMSLMDTADGFFMTTAYKWALSTPLRKVYYNLSVTGLGVLAALVIGLIELAQVLIPELGLHCGIWVWIQGLNFNGLGYVLVSLFALVYGISFCVWKLFRVEER